MKIDINNITNLPKLRERLNSKLEVDGECLVYTGPIDIGGYGKIGVTVGKGNYKHAKAHRISYMLSKGNIPDGLVVMHSCDNPKCCRIEHLSLGTQRDNMEDKVLKGRAGGAYKGINHHHSKLTNEQVKWAYKSTLRNKEIASILSVDVSRISMIKSGKTWRHLTIDL